MSLIKRPVFIVGVPRSGTTLLSTILSTSPDLSIAPEIWFFNYWVKKYSFLDFRKEADFLFFMNVFLNSKRFEYLELDKEKVSTLILGQQEKSFTVIIASVLKVYAEKHNKSIVGEKTPGQFKNIDTILSTFPDCKIIGLLRSPYAVVASTLEAGFASNANVLTVAKRWKNYLSIIEKYKYNPQVKIIRYEDLVIEPQKIITEIADYLKIDLQSETVASSREGSYSLGKRDDHWANTHLNKSLKPVDTNSLEKWRRTLSDTDIQIINSIIGGGEIKEFDYPFETPKTQLNTSQVRFLLKKYHIVGKISNLKKRQNLLNRRTKFNRISYKLFGKVYERN